MAENTSKTTRVAQQLAVLGLTLVAVACGSATSPQPQQSIGAFAGAPASVPPTTAAPPAAMKVGATNAPGVTTAPAVGSMSAGAASSPNNSAAAPATPPATNGNAGPTTPVAGAVTYQHDIRPIVESRCVSCHVAGGAGPFPLDTWESVDKVKAAIIPAVTSHRMPPWPADDTDCVKQRNNQRLTDAQLALFEKWKDGGFQQGAPSEFAPLVEAEPVPELGEPTLLVTPEPYQLTPNFEGYICSQTDAKLTEDVWVRALDLKPEHAEYVHHAIINIGSGNCDALGVSAENLYSYRPGSHTVVFEEGDAMKLPAGQKIAIQFHYNTRGAPPAMSYPTDASPLRLWTLPKGQKPKREIHRQPIHAINISIPVGAVDQAVTTAQGLQAGTGAEIIGISPHMHYLGQHFKQTLSGGGANNTCLVYIPDWDQSWQIDYLYKPSEYIKVMPGMTINQECVYSNRPEDQGTGPDGKPYTPQFTTFGEDTRNEMCLGYVWYREPLAAGGFN